MNNIPKLLSKTKILRGYRCLKQIYQTIHNPHLEAPIGPDQQAVFDQGHRVGEEARKRFPHGVLVDNKPWDFIGSLKKTRELLALKTETIFEAAFEYKGCYARADIIQYSKDTERWKIFEVKSSTKVKDEQVDDVALQAWIMSNGGLPIEQVNIMHLNNLCKFPHLENLFISEDVTDRVRNVYPKITPTLNEIFSAIRADRVPDVDIGKHCLYPQECGFKAACWKEKNIPELSVLNLPQIKDKKWQLYSEGILNLDDPRLTDLSDLQLRVVEVFKTGKRYVDAEALKASLKDWKFPLVFLDFETINPAIPRYEGTWPYQQVPFQFSVHTWASPETGELVHREYLHTTKSDPRPEMIPKLLEACGTEGSILAYFGQFESERIKELADFAPDYKDALLKLVDRIVDPLPIIRDHVYDNAFAGSFSLKNVGPALLGESSSYEGMLVGNGTAAQRAFEEMISDSVTIERRQELARASLEYCKKDTLVMLELVRWMMSAK